MDDKLIIIIEITNNNHLSNVKTLQSVFKQDYPCLELAVLNDDTAAFQSERFLYNVTDHVPPTFRRVQIIENAYPMGEVASVKTILEKSDAEYVVILHAGERFSSAHTLSNALSALERYVVAKGLQAKGDMVSAYFLRRDFLLGKLQHTNGERTIYELVCAGTNETDSKLTPYAEPICVHEEKDLEDTVVEIPKELGNKTLKNITALLSGQSGTKEALQPQTKKNVAQKQIITQKKKLILWLHKNSRFERLKIDVLIELFLVCLSILIFGEHISLAAGIGASVLAAFQFLWLILMLACNMYFRRHPERLIM